MDFPFSNILHCLTARSFFFLRPFLCKHILDQIGFFHRLGINYLKSIEIKSTRYKLYARAVVEEIIRKAETRYKYTYMAIGNPLKTNL